MSASYSRHIPSFGALTLLVIGCGPGALPSEPDVARGGEFSDAGAIEGRYEMRIARMLDGSSRTSHHIKTPDEVFEIVLDEPLEERVEYESWIRVPGEKATDGRWAADELIVVAPPPQPLIDPEFRDPRRIGTVLVFWNGQGLENGSASDSMYTGNSSTNVYYGENSYGIETMAGKVFGPYEIDDPGGCNENIIVDRAEAEMRDRGHDPSQFRQMMFHFPGGAGCGYAGLASVGSPDNPARNSWYHGSFGCTTRNQELGHNYGMGHSHAYNCPATPDGMDHNLYGDCEHVEYGHPYDPMGDGCGHMNVVQKTYMGWIEGCNVVTATSDGVFNLMPTEIPCDGTQALRIPMYDGRYYYLEYRNGDGEFAVGGGVLINVAPDIGGFGPPNYVLDELGDDENGYLHEGDTFTDPGSTTMFTILEEHDSHVVIQVSVEGGGDGLPPTCYEGAGEPMMDGGAIGSMSCADGPYPGDMDPPEVEITYPLDGDVFPPGTDFTITADATDNRGVIEVELYLNGEPFDVRTEPPWEWPATNIPAGSYEFGVVARDAVSWAPSEAVSIEVAVEEPPTEDSSGGMDTDSLPPDTGDETTGDGQHWRWWCDRPQERVQLPTGPDRWPWGSRIWADGTRARVAPATSPGELAPVPVAKRSPFRRPPRPQVIGRLVTLPRQFQSSTSSIARGITSRTSSKRCPASPPTLILRFANGPPSALPGTTITYSPAGNIDPTVNAPCGSVVALATALPGGPPFACDATYTITSVRPGDSPGEPGGPSTSTRPRTRVSTPPVVSA